MAFFDRLVADLVTRPAKRMAVAHAADRDVLEAVRHAVNAGVVIPRLVGDARAIRTIADDLGLSLDPNWIIDAADPIESSRRAVAAVRNGEADVLMKGLVPTATLLKAVLDHDTGLRGPGLLSHIGAFELAALDRPLFLTDAAINIAPSLDDKVAIIKNAVAFVHALGLNAPKIGLLAAVETVNPKMVATTDAQALVEMACTGVFGDAILGGPFALDNALFVDAAVHKGISDPVAGHADILLAPTIETGNALYKAMTFLAGAASGGVVVGATAPIVMTSRADNETTKWYAIVLALAAAETRTV